MDAFVDRATELAELDDLARHHGLVVVFGRRRIGKTKLLGEWLRRRGGLYSQAIEGSTPLQLAQVYADLRERLGVAIEPRTWQELFALFDAHRGRLVVCLDEFPYLVAADPSLPSVLQRWLDHRTKRDVLLVVAGSSTRMMNAMFLDANAPLYGRALKILAIGPIPFRHFCRYARLRPDQRSFQLFSLVGGVPKYWEWLEVAARGHRKDPIEIAERMFFQPMGWMEDEPRRVLADERLAGLPATSVLEAIGRGAHRPSEIAGRLGVAQTTLSKVFQALLDASLVIRDIPFGASERDPKRTLYRLGDPALRFWYSVYSPHRTRWATYAQAAKSELLASHCGAVFEDWLRGVHPGARRYWDGTVEFDMVREEQRRGGGARLVVTDIKWRIAPAESPRLLAQLAARFERSSLAKRHPDVRFEVIDASELPRLAQLQP